MEKIKVLHISNTDFFINKLMLNKLIGLKDSGYIVHAMAPSGKHVEKIQKHVKFHHLTLNREISLIDDIKSTMALIKILKEEEYHIVHTHSSKAGIVGRIAAKLTKTPIIIHTAHGLPFYDGQNKIKYNIYKHIEKIAGKISDAILSQNKQDLDKILEYKIGKKDNTHYEGNGVNIERLDRKYSKTDKEALIQELSLENKTVIGFYARLEPVKGHLFFLDAFKDVVEKHPDAICLFAGGNFGLETSYQQQVMDKIQQLNLQNNVKVLGFRDDIHSILAITDILVLPSKKEGIPRIVMEAMTYQIPVIGTDVLGTREVVKDQYNGYLVPYGDTQTLSTKLSNLLQNKDLRAQYGKNGRQFIEQHHNEHQVVQRLHKIYTALITQKISKQTPTDIPKSTTTLTN